MCASARRPGARWRPARRAARRASSCRAGAGRAPGRRSPSSRARRRVPSAALDQLGAAMLLVTEPKPLLGRFEQGAQQLPLPFVPHARPDRADVDDRQHQQQPQPFGALHLADEILDRLGVGEVALERRRRQQQVVADEPGDGLRLCRIETEARAQLERDLGAEHAVVAAAALGDVVQQHRDVEHPARRDLLEDAVESGWSFLARRARSPRAGRSRGSNARRPYNDGTCRTASARRRGRSRERSGRIRRPRSSSAAPARAVDAGQHLQEERVGARVSRTLRSISAASRAAARIAAGWISSRSRAASANSSSRRTGSARKKSSRRDRNPAAVEHEAAEPLGPAADRRKREAEALLAQLLVELRKEHAGKVADRLRVEEIELHEPLDRGFPGPVGVMHDLGDVRLIVEARAAPRRGRRADAGGSAPPRRSARRARSA